ncbi:unnamed protein product, partial [Porites evermanni]
IRKIIRRVQKRNIPDNFMNSRHRISILNIAYFIMTDCKKQEKMSLFKQVLREITMILKAFLKTIPTKMKPTKCPAREKKMRQEKRNKKAGEKARSRNFAFCACPLK